MYKRRENRAIQKDGEFFQAAIPVFREHFYKIYDANEMVTFESVLLKMDPQVSESLSHLRHIAGGRILAHEVTKTEILYRPEFMTKSLGPLQRHFIDPRSQLFEEPGNLIGFTFVTELKQGASFGEKGLDEGTPRTATILCSSDCEFACLLKADYDQLLKEVNKEKMEKINDFFYSLVFKNSITRALVNSIGGDFSKNVLRMKKGQYLFCQGSLDQNVYVVRSGMILLEYMVETEDRFLDIPVGAKRVTKTVHGIYKVLEGEILGEECLFDELPKKVSARVVSNDAEIMWTTKPTLRNYVVHSTVLEDFFKALVKTKIGVRDTIITNVRAGIASVGLGPPLPVNPVSEVHTSEGKKTTKPPVFYLPKTQKYKEVKAMNFEEIRKVHFNPQAEFMRKEYPKRGGKFPLLKDCEQVLQSTMGEEDSVAGGKSRTSAALEMDPKIFEKNYKFTQDILNYRRNLVKQRGYGRVTKKPPSPSRAGSTAREDSSGSGLLSPTRRGLSESGEEPYGARRNLQSLVYRQYPNSSIVSSQDFVRGDMWPAITPKRVLLSLDEEDTWRATGRKTAGRETGLFSQHCRSMLPQAIRASPFKRHNSKTTRCLDTTDDSTHDIGRNTGSRNLFPKIAECLRSKSLDKTKDFINGRKFEKQKHSIKDLFVVVQSSCFPSENSEAQSVELEDAIQGNRPNLSKLKASSIMLMTPEASTYKH